MGIYIKDYKIPNGECEHLILDFENMTAFAAFGDRKHYKLIEVIEPHGDLIDRDRAIDGAKVDGAWAALAYEPTVIEAEGK